MRRAATTITTTTNFYPTRLQHTIYPRRSSLQAAAASSSWLFPSLCFLETTTYINMRFKCSLTWAPALVAVTFPSTTTLAWAPTSSYTTTPSWAKQQQQQQQQQQHRPFSSSSSSFASSSSLFQSKIDMTVLPDDEVVLEGTTITSTTTTKNCPALMPTGKPLAEGTVVATFPGGMVALRIDDDDDDDGTDKIIAVLDRTKSFISKRGSGENSKSSIGGDLMGHNVVFPNGGPSGVVVTHRPPIIFAYFDESSSSSSSSIQLTDVKKGSNNKATIYDSLSTIHIPAMSSSSTSFVETIQSLDCFGRRLIMTEEEEELPSNSSSSSSPPASTEGGFLSRPIFAPIPQLKDIALINTPMLTGVTMFDALSPIGKGQNMLLIGHDRDDLRRYACAMMSLQIGHGNDQQNDTMAAAATHCIYAATTETHKEAEQRLQMAGLANHVTLVACREMQSDKKKDIPTAGVVSQAAESITIAATACAIAEALAVEEGKNVLVIVDTIDPHKVFWDMTTRVLVDEFGIDAVVKGDREGAASSEMRAFYSSLIQRSAQYKLKRGGGSVTLLLLTTIPKLAPKSSTLSMKEDPKEEFVFTLEDFVDSTIKIRARVDMLVSKKIPLTAANLQRIDIPLPSEDVTEDQHHQRQSLMHVDDLISMSDGQIWLDEKLERLGRIPPMDPQRSVARVGIGADTNSRADAPALRRIAEGLRLAYSQAADSMEGGGAGGAETSQTSPSSHRQFRKWNSLLLAMHQEHDEGLLGGTGGGHRKLSETCVVLLAATRGHFDASVDHGIRAGTTEGNTIIQNLLEHVRKVARSAMNDVDTTEDLSDTTYTELEDAIKSYFAMTV